MTRLGGGWAWRWVGLAVGLAVVGQAALGNRVGRRAALAMLTCLAALPARAEDWRPLANAEITKTLERNFLRYDDGSEQFFNYGGLTAFRVGWPNEGRWRVSQDRYCSLWSPQIDWECFAVAASADGRRVRFTDADGQVTIAAIMVDQD